MATPGYSGTPLIKKLGIKAGMKVRLLNPPHDYFEFLGEDISPQVVKSGGDLVHLFTVSAKALETCFHQLVNAPGPPPVIWISWYKKSAKMQTDITEDTIRDIVLPTGWVDVKVCAVSDVWSGLKIVKRVAATKRK